MYKFDKSTKDMNLETFCEFLKFKNRLILKILFRKYFFSELNVFAIIENLQDRLTRELKAETENLNKVIF